MARRSGDQGSGLGPKLMGLYGGSIMGLHRGYMRVQGLGVKGLGNAKENENYYVLSRV